MRVISGAVLIGAVGATIWLLPAWATALVAALAAAFAAREVIGLASALGARVSAVPAALGAAALAWQSAMPATTRVTPTDVFLAVLLIGGAILLASGAPSRETLTGATATLMAPLYTGLPLGAIAWAHGAAGPAATSWLIAMIALSDSAQYYTGRAFGRRKLAPAISPAKTIEGAMGGLVLTAIGGALLGPICLRGTAPLAAGALAIALAVAGMVGDLFESLLKRSAGVKDSGSIIPGHGGLLDRLDSYLFAAPVFAMYLRYLA